MPVKEAIDLLRTRFNRLRAGDTFERLAIPIRVGRMRLSSFASGAILKFDDLDKIERWCDEQEGMRGHS